MFSIEQRCHFIEHSGFIWFSRIAWYLSTRYANQGGRCSMLQPAGTQAPADVAARTAAAVEELYSLEGPLLPILHGLQEEFGYVPKESLPIAAQALNISHAEAHGVASFYHDCRKAPAGRHVLKMCRAEACQSMGSDAMAERMEQLLGVRFGGTSAWQEEYSDRSRRIEGRLEVAERGAAVAFPSPRLRGEGGLH